MSRYGNLKDYLELNNKDTIFRELNSFIIDESNSGACIQNTNDITIHTLAWNNFESETLSKRFLTFTIGIFAVITSTHNNHSQLHYYNITMRGNLRKQLSDLVVTDISEVHETLLQKESVLSLFGLPTNITADTLEETAEKFYAAYCPDKLIDKTRRYSLPVVNIKNHIGCKMWYADLPDNCLGRMYLNQSVADIYDMTTSLLPVRYPNETVPFGTILLNYSYFRMGDRTDDIVVTAHELIHWHYHQPFMEIISLLDSERDSIDCSAEPLLPDDSMTIAEKAYWYAEWQANELSIRVAMPKHLIEEAIAEYERCNSGCAHNGAYYENMIYKLSWDFNVPAQIMKKRFRQLGYDYADGTFVSVDECQYQPFTFAQGTLKENDTFVIDRANYERLLREDNSFAELINSVRYIYLGYVVCLVDKKYIDVSINENSVHFQLTPYAREHADECCIKFTVNSVVITGKERIKCGQAYLSKIDKKLLKQYEACIPDDLKENINDFVKENSRLEKMQTYGETLAYYLFEDNREIPVQVKNENGDFSYEANTIIKSFAYKVDLSETIIKEYLKNCEFPKLETAMRICLGLGLNETQSRDMLKKAGHNIDAPTPENKVCKLIFRLSEEQATTVLNNWKMCVEHLKKMNVTKKHLFES